MYRIARQAFSLGRAGRLGALHPLAPPPSGIPLRHPEADMRQIGGILLAQPSRPTDVAGWIALLMVRLRPGAA